jgi:hypothetical protein
MNEQLAIVDHGSPSLKGLLNIAGKTRAYPARPPAPPDWSDV